MTKDPYVFVKVKCPMKLAKDPIIKDLLALRVKHEPNIELVIEFE